MPNIYVGRSQYSVDPHLHGSAEEFCVYSRALSPREVLTLASSG
jgi:hypothetical protein